MPEVMLPFDVQEVHANHNDFHECGLFGSLPRPMQEVCRQNAHLMEYLHALPIGKVGVPQYYPEPSRKLGDLAYRNLLYPISRDVLVHVWSTGSGERDVYIPVEPSLFVKLNGKMTQVENRLLDMAHRFANAPTREDKEQALLEVLGTICQVTTGEADNQQKRGGFLGLFVNGGSNGKVRVTEREFQAIKYLVLRDKAGLGILEPMIQDKNIEDISCSGLGHIFLEHKIFKGVKSAVVFQTQEELDEFVLRLSDQIKKPVTLRNPIVDATLPDGSRVNIVFGRDVSLRGSNLTIRKFTDTPLSILELIEFGSLDYRMAAYLSLVLEEGMNTFVAGETASGKTTLLNAMTTFVPPKSKVVSIEDTPEIQVPHPNWIREVAKAVRRGEQGPDVSMLDLLKAALRQRPNLIIIGEIRGEEGAIAFQAMQTGHAVMATFHAASVEKLIQRLTGHPIDVPKTYIDNLNVVVIQSAVKLPNGKTARRTVSINEIVGYDPPSDSFSFVEVFRWNSGADTFEFVGDKNSYILEEKIAPRRGLSGNKKFEIYTQLDRRADILRRLHLEKRITNFYELLKVLARAQQEGLF